MFTKVRTQKGWWSKSGKVEVTFLGYRYCIVTMPKNAQKLGTQFRELQYGRFANGSFFDSLQIKWALFQTVCLFEASELNFLNPVSMESTWQTIKTSRCPHLGIGNADMSGGAWAFELEAKQNDRTESTQAANLNSVWVPITFCLLAFTGARETTHIAGRWYCNMIALRIPDERLLLVPSIALAVAFPASLCLGCKFRKENPGLEGNL